MKTFGERLKLVIRESGLTVKVLTIEADLCDEAHLYHMLAGRHHPSLATLQRILAVLPQADARWLVCGGTRTEQFVFTTDELSTDCIVVR